MFILRVRLWNDLINNKEYILRKNIFNKGNKNKLYSIDVDRADASVVLNRARYVAPRQGGRNKQNRIETAIAIQ